jgi:hypothetical protein
MAFDLVRLLKRVDIAIVKDFVMSHGGRDAAERIEWQQENIPLASDVLSALREKNWALGALESCVLIAEGGGRALLRSAGHHRPELMHGVDNPEWTDESCAVWLALRDERLFDHVVSAAHAMKGLGSRSWDAFRIRQREQVVVQVEDEDRLARFTSAARMVLQNAKGVATWRQLAVDHFTHQIPRLDSHSRRPWLQINVFAEQAPRIVEYMAKDGAIDKISLPRLYRASILFDPAGRTVEVVAQGGRLVRDGLVDAFRSTFLPDGITTDRLVRREIDFQLFRTRPDFRIEPDDPIAAVVVDEVRLFPPDSEGGLVTIEQKRVDRAPRDVYRVAKDWFGEENPIGKPGWNFAGVRLRLTFKPKRVGQKGHVRTIELRSPRGTNLREQVEEDRLIAEGLFKRWGIFGIQADADK